MSRVKSVRISLGYKARFLILSELSTRHVTQAELARRIGHSEKHVSQVLTGAVSLSVDMADAMFAALDREWVVGSVPALGEPSLENWTIMRAGSDE